MVGSGRVGVVGVGVFFVRDGVERLRFRDGVGVDFSFVSVFAVFLNGDGIAKSEKKESQLQSVGNLFKLFEDVSSKS